MPTAYGQDAARENALYMPCSNFPQMPGILSDTRGRLLIWPGSPILREKQHTFRILQVNHRNQLHGF